jgi:5-methylcytosine-specific restriction endonuclease McrA
MARPHLPDWVKAIQKRKTCREFRQRRGPAGRKLCVVCEQEVPPGRISWCGQACVDKFKLATDSNFIRQALLERDRGVCALCQLDTEQWVVDLRKRFWTLRNRHYTARFVTIVRPDAKLDPARRKFATDHPEVALACRLDEREFVCWLNDQPYEMVRHFGLHGFVQSFFECDHRIPLVLGGEANLDNLRTLCVGCHRIETAKLRTTMSKTIPNGKHLRLVK